jgi:hypothetical protein
MLFSTRIIQQSADIDKTGKDFKTLADEEFSNIGAGKKQHHKAQHSLD